MWLRRRRGGDGRCWEIFTDKEGKRGKRGKRGGGDCHLESFSDWICSWDLNRISENERTNLQLQLVSLKPRIVFITVYFIFVPIQQLTHIFYYSVDIVMTSVYYNPASVVDKVTATVCTPNAPLGLRCHATLLFVSPLGCPYCPLLLTHSLTHCLKLAATHPTRFALRGGNIVPTTSFRIRNSL